jgi:hypothetical protein
MIPDKTFIRVLEAGDDGTVEDTAIKVQERHKLTLKLWAKKHNLFFVAIPLAATGSTAIHNE